MSRPADQILDRLGRLQLAEETRPRPDEPDPRLLIVCLAFTNLVDAWLLGHSGYSDEFEEAAEILAELDILP